MFITCAIGIIEHYVFKALVGHIFTNNRVAFENVRDYILSDVYNQQ